MVVARLSRRLSVPLALALALLLLAGIAPLPVRATSFAVTVTMNDANSPGGSSDVVHSLPGCAVSGMAPCSLRDAVIYANGHNGAGDTTTITLPAGTYTLTRSGANEDAAATGDLDIIRNVSINGAGAGTTIIQASPNPTISGIDRVFEVGALGTPLATISGVTIRYGFLLSGTDGAGIAVRSGSSLNVSGCVISDNRGSRVSTTGGIYNAGTVTVTNSTFSGNSASQGGGVYNNGGTLTVTNSTFSGNNSDFGGGIYHAGGTVTVTNSTLSGNIAASGVGGGLVGIGGTLIVTNSTFSGNSAATEGGGIYNSGSTLTAVNTLIAGNSSIVGPDVVSTFATGSKNNLLGDGSGAAGIADNDANHNIVGHLALLDTTLRDNGTTTGTQTLALLPGSPAINAGDTGTCANTAGPAPVGGVDQRGIARPQPPGGRCDIGAYEFVFVTTVALAASPNPAAVGQSVTFTANVTGTGTATGSVTFKDGATTLGFAPLVSGVATFATAGLAAGSHAITAVYGGDAVTFPPGTSPVLTEVVGSGGGGPPPTTGLQFYPLSQPVRLLDTRPGATAFRAPGAPLAPNQPLTLPGRFTYQGVTIPPAAQALVGNATVDDSIGAPPGFATLYPSGAALPLASNLNFVPGTVRPNAFTVGLGSDGTFNLLSNTGGNFIVDITGYYAPPAAGGLFFHPLSAPIRLLDTRAGQSAFVHPNTPLAPGQTLSLPGQFATIPNSTKALAGNATVDNTANAPPGFATLFPGGTSLPLASNLNFVPGTVAPNAFTVGLGADGSMNLYSSTGGNFIVDVTGYYDANGAGGLLFYPLAAPVRELDTRAGQQAFRAPGAALTAGQTLNLPGSFAFNGVTVPSSAKALVGNATVDNSGNAPPGFATLYPGGTALPLASNLNYVPGTVAPNAFIVGVGSDGTYNLYSLSGGNFIVDLSGYFAAGAGTSATPAATKKP